MTQDEPERENWTDKMGDAIEATPHGRRDHPERDKVEEARIGIDALTHIRRSEVAVLQQLYGDKSEQYVAERLAHEETRKALSLSERRADEAERQLGECSGGYETLEKELAIAERQLARVVKALKRKKDQLIAYMNGEGRDRSDASTIAHAYIFARGRLAQLNIDLEELARSALHRSQED